jgi:PAS domain S-box-containing protein
MDIMTRKTEEKNTRIHLIYYALAAVDVITIAFSIFIISLIVNLYKETVDKSETWVERQNLYIGTLDLAAQMNAPGNDIFSSKNTQIEMSKYNKIKDDFNLSVAEINSDFLKNLKNDKEIPLKIRREIHKTIKEIYIDFKKFDEKAQNVFLTFDNNQALAGQYMAEMDQNFAKLQTDISSLASIIGQYLKIYVNEQAIKAQIFQSYKTYILVVLIFMVLAVAIYGHVLAEKIKKQQIEMGIQKEKYLAIFDNAADGIITIDDSGSITDYNNSCEHIFGYSYDEMIGKNISVLVEQKHRDKHDAYIEKYLETGASKIIGKGREVKAVKKDGKIIDLYIAVSESSIEGKNIFTAIIRDMREQKAFEQELKNARKDAEKANMAKSDFIANLSHEIRTPMNGIIGTASIMSGLIKDEKNTKYLQTIMDSGDQLLSIINDVLDISKIEAGKLVISIEPFNIKKSLKSVFELFEGSARSKGIEYLLEIDPDIPEYVMGDNGRIRQVVTNFISNAIKFTDEGSVKLQANMVKKIKGDAIIRISVEDTGHGIDKKHHKELFEKFTQFEGSSKINNIGTGLGLSICKSIVDMIGGQIMVESEKGSGSTFCAEIRLPISNLKAANYDTDEVKSNFSGKVLLAEDNETNQMVISTMLEGLGLKVDIANNGKEAVNMSAKQNYSLIFMDVRMPKMDGLKATNIIKTRDNEDGIKAPPIIALTAQAMEQQKQECIKAGMDEFLPKPLKKEALEKAVAKYLK